MSRLRDAVIRPSGPIRMRLRKGLNKLRRVSVFQLINMTGLTLFAVFMALPIVFIINHAFKPINELFIFPPRFIVENPTMFNFQQLMLRTQTLFVPFSRYLFNSLLTTTLTIIGVIFVSSLAAYTLSKLEFPGKRLFFSLTIISMMFAPETVNIPRFLVVSGLGLVDTYAVHILPLIAAPVSVFLLKQFTDQIPKELIEAAKIDGAQEFTIFLRIVMPLCMPAVMTVGILTFQASWGQSETSTLFTQQDAMKTLPFYVETLTSGLANNVVGQGIAAAAGLMMFMPNLIIFLLFQRRVLSTMAHSGIK